MRELAPQFHIPWSIPMEAEDIPIVPTTSGTMYVLEREVKLVYFQGSGFLDTLQNTKAMQHYKINNFFLKNLVQQTFIFNLMGFKRMCYKAEI